MKKEDAAYQIGGGTYTLITTYVGWLPEQFTDWFDWLCQLYFKEDKKLPQETTLLNPERTESIELIMYRSLSKEAFPIPFSAQEYSDEWFRFCIVSKKETPEDKFIIPLH